MKSNVKNYSAAREFGNLVRTQWNTLQSKKIGNEFHKNTAKTLKRALLVATALAGFASTPVMAGGTYSDFLGNPQTINSAADPLIVASAANDPTVVVNSNQNSSITVNTLLGAPSTITVNSGVTLNSAVWGIWNFGTTGPISVTNNGTLTAAGGLANVYLTNTTGKVSVNGAGVINAGTIGVSAITTTGEIAIGNTTRLGAITAGTTGVYAVNSANPIGVNVSSVAATAGNGIWTVGLSGAQTITATGAVSGLTGQYLNASTGNISTDGLGTGTLTGTALDGALVTTTGNVTVNNYATVTGNRNGIYVLGTPGITNIHGNGLVGGITGTALNGIVVGPASGNVNIGTVRTNGVITAAANGIWVNNTGAGNNAIVQNNNVTGGAGFYGIITGTATGATSITATAATSGGTGIGAISTSGAIIADGKGTGTVTGTTVDGVLFTTLGNATVQNFATVTGARNGIYVLGTAGVTNVQGNGLTGGVTGTALNGIVVGPSSGDVHVGDVATNGVILGGVNGIWINNSGGAGNTFITVNKNVTGTSGDGILSTTTSGNQTNNIQGPAIVQGGLYGLATATTTGTATTNNTGTIQNIGDAVGAASNAGRQAVWLGSGNNIVNNNAGGRIIGGFTTGGIANTLNNNVGSIWTPSLLNAFGAATDRVNNTGLINIRTGVTTFAGLEQLNNNAGGVIDLTYGGTQATNSLIGSVNFAPSAGSTIKVAFNPILANNAGLGADSSSNTKGTADTILAATITAGAKSTINLTTVGSVDSLIGTSGSVAIVQGAAILGDPGLGAVGKFVASTKYTLVGDPTTGAVKFNLSDAADGGAFLQWSPNITSATMGAFGGGDLTTKSGTGSAIGAARGGVSGAGSVAAMLGGQGATAGICQRSDRRSNLWTTMDIGGASYKGGGSGSNFGGALGWEGKIGKQGEDDCSDNAIGLFGYGNTGKTKFATGRSNADGYGVGAYIRTVRPGGFYASLLGTAGTIESKLTNNIFQSRAKSDALGLMADATAGIVKPIGSKAKLDLRGSVTYLSLDADAFTDTKGITVTSMKSDLWTAAASLGLIAPAGDKSAFYIRGGAKYSDLSRTTNAYDVIIANSANEIAGTGEIGFNSLVSDRTTFGIGGYGDVSSSTTNYGGRVSLRVAF
jgi:hypothetical protein